MKVDPRLILRAERDASVYVANYFATKAPMLTNPPNREDLFREVVEQKLALIGIRPLRRAS